MKLTKLHVENFGALQNFDFIPSAGLNRLEYPNGWGKSTLAAFLKAMLFGLPSARGSEEKNERKKYAPWQGGLFGGTLELSCSLGEFRIERSFGLRPMQDSLSVIDLATGRPSDRLGETPGETLLGINADGFDKSVYYTRRELSDSGDGNASITARLNSLLDNVEDAGSFECAIDQIKSAKKDLENPRGGDKLASLGDQLFDTRRVISRLEEKRGDLAALEERLAACNDSLAALEQSEEDFRQRKESYLLLQARKKLLLEKSAVKAKLDALEALFCGYPLSKEDLQALSIHCRDLQAANARTEALKEAFPKAEYERLTQTPLPDETTLKKAEALAKERTELSKTLAGLQNEPSEPAKNAKPLFVFAACLALFGIGAAILALLLKKPLLLIGTLLFLAGSGALFAIGCSKRKKAGNSQNEKAILLQRIAGLDKAFGRLSPALFGEKAEEELVLRLRRDIERVARLKLEKERLESAKADSEKLAASLEAFSLRYGTPAENGDPAATLLRLTGALAEIEWNRSLLSEKEAQEVDLNRKIGDLPEDLQSASPSEEPDWRAKRAEYETERKKLEREIDILSADIDRIPELSDWVAAKEADLARRKEKLAILEKTDAYLKTAKDSLSARYRTGIERLLPSYLERAASTLPESRVDPDLQVYYYAGGKSRPLSAFSQGERDLTDFCLRLSLTESLSAGGETPFLLLDDPFVNLDDDRYAAVVSIPVPYP